MGELIIMTREVRDGRLRLSWVTNYEQLDGDEFDFSISVQSARDLARDLEEILAAVAQPT